MTDTSGFQGIFYTDTAAFLFFALSLAWQKSLRGRITMIRASGVSLAAIPFINAIRTKDPAMAVLALVILLVRAVIMPSMISRAISKETALRASLRSLNTTASILGAGAVIILGFAASQGIIAVAPTPTMAALPIPFGAMLIGVSLLLTRKQVVDQLIAFLLLDNGISACAFILTLGIPAVVELGALLDVVLLILVLVLLAGKLRPQMIGIDIDGLRELHE